MTMANNLLARFSPVASGFNRGAQSLFAPRAAGGQQPAPTPNPSTMSLQNMLQQAANQPSRFSFQTPPEGPNQFQSFMQRAGGQMPSTPYFQFQQPAAGPSRLPPAMQATMGGNGFGRFSFGAPDGY